ncbi:MAG: hypothetical protein ACRC7N_05135 [Clostridium sp.]
MKKNILKPSKKGSVTLTCMFSLALITLIMIGLTGVVLNNIKSENLSWRSKSGLDVREALLSRAQDIIDYVNNNPSGKEVLDTSFDIRVGATNYRIGSYNKRRDTFVIYLGYETINCSYKFEELCNCGNEDCTLKNGKESLILLL